MNVKSFCLVSSNPSLDQGGLKKNISFGNFLSAVFGKNSSERTATKADICFKERLFSNMILNKSKPHIGYEVCAEIKYHK